MTNLTNYKKVLVIDDDLATRFLISEILEAQNISKIESCTGDEGFQAFLNNQNEIFLILLDLRLPDCDGIELLRKFRQVKMYIPIIAMSAVSPAELAGKCHDSGFDAYISKPFNIEKLVKIMVKYLETIK